MRMAQHVAAWAKSGGWVNPYVTDGLVAMFDGEWNAGGGVHDPNATVWKDIIGGNDAVKVSSISNAWSEKSCVFEGFAGQGFYFDVGNIDFSSGLSIEVVSKNTNNGRSLCSRDVWSTTLGRYYYGIDFSSTGGNYGCIANSTDIAFNFSRTESIPFKSNYAITIDGSRMRFFCNGVLKNSGVCGLTTAYSKIYTIGSYLFSRNPTSDMMIGDVFNIRFYNRVVDEQVLAANYVVDKTRFGLTRIATSFWAKRGAN